ncbi:MAG: hypothetical protein SGI71_01490 [Verrucomicrobiota bacterium]|nr:hypothetical protein [Verrucomicrobiota bacterium]
MPLLLLLIALIMPRVVVFGLYFFSNWFNSVFNTLLWPLLGLIFMPVTLLYYSAVINWSGGWGTFQVVGLVIAALIDLTPSRGLFSRRSRRRVED